MSRDLSVLVPARNEEWLGRTVDDVLAHRAADTEVIVILDGAWPVEPLPQHPDVTIVHRPKSIGQRAATNEAARLSGARYIMKLDAHCSLAQGFDAELIKAAADLGTNVTQIPAQKNLHVYDWLCDACGHRQDQGPTRTACDKCGSPRVRREILWEPRPGSTTSAWRFDADLHFQYWKDFRDRPEGRGDICDVMTSLGACFFMERARFWQLGGLDEACGSWGQYGVEIACKSWLSGGRQVVNKRTWFAHFFRVGGIGFPYEIHGSDQDRARDYSRAFWRGNRWPGQVRHLHSLVEQFWPVPGWTDEQLADLKGAAGTLGYLDFGRDTSVVLRGLEHVFTGSRESTSAQPAASAAPVARRRWVPPVLGAPSSPPPTLRPIERTLERRDGPVAVRRAQAKYGIVYYSDCRPEPLLLEAAQRTMEALFFPIVAVTLKPISWQAPVERIVLPLERGVLTMFRQILAGLEALRSDYAFLCEHDVLYHPSHFTFEPPRPDTYYYNENVWKVDLETGRALFYWTKQTSGLCAARDLLVEHYRARVARVEREGFERAMGFEPGCHRPPRGVDSHPAERWLSEYPNVDVRHGHNLTPSRWSREEFRSQRNCEGWTQADEVPGWGRTRGRVQDILRSVVEKP